MDYKPMGSEYGHGQTSGSEYGLQDKPVGLSMDYKDKPVGLSMDCKDKPVGLNMDYKGKPVGSEYGLQRQTSGV